MDNNKKSALVDAAVAIVFFNRDDTLKEVFKRISQARPSELFLIQDGPRETMKMTKRILKNAEPFVKISIGNARSTEITPKKYGLRNTRRNRYRLGF